MGIRRSPSILDFRRQHKRQAVLRSVADKTQCLDLLDSLVKVERARGEFFEVVLSVECRSLLVESIDDKRVDTDSSRQQERAPLCVEQESQADLLALIPVIDRKPAKQDNRDLPYRRSARHLLRLKSTC